jgi:hypothetical protein
MKTFKERRKHERYIINKQPTLLLSPITVLSYGVLDISYSGLAFVYAGWENWPKKEIMLDIIDENFYMEDIPIHVIGDVKIDDGSKTLKVLRRCGIKFNGLKDNQKAILRQYIENVAAN